MSAPSNPIPPTTRAEQRDQIEFAAKKLSAALRALLTDASVGRQARTVDELEKRIGVSRVLAWQVLRLADKDMSVEDLRNLPGKRAFQSFLRAIQKGGIAKLKVSEAHEAYEEIGDLIQELGGDLPNFLEIAFHINKIQNLTEASTTLRNSFKASSRIWGISARTVYSCWILNPLSEQSGEYEVAFLSIQVGVRPQGRDEFAFRRHQARTGKVLHSLPFQDQGDPSGLPTMVRAFCEGAIPELSVRNDGAHQVANAKYDRLGRPAEHTLAFAEASTMKTSRSDGKGDFVAGSRMPCEEIVSDFLYLRNTPARILKRSTCLDADLPAPMVEHLIPSLGLNIPIEVSGIVHPIEHNTLDGYARLPEFLAYAFDSLGWNPGDFVGERARVAYPPAQCRLVTEVELRSK